MILSTVTHDTFVIAPTYDSPIANVFRAWADPNRKARWFAGSADALGNGYELDFQVGGREVNRGGPPGGPIYGQPMDPAVDIKALIQRHWQASEAGDLEVETDI